MAMAVAKAVNINVHLLVQSWHFIKIPLQYLSDLTQMNHSAAAAYTSMAQPFGVAAHTPPHMGTVRQDSMGKFQVFRPKSNDGPCR